LGIERLDDGDDPTPPADPAPSKDAARSGEVPSSSDVGRAKDQTPDNSPRESAEDTTDQQAESRTRDEYADHIAPPNSRPPDKDRPNPGTEESDHSERGQREATRHEERSDVSWSEDLRGADRLQLANGTEGSDEVSPNPGDRPTDLAQREEPHGRGKQSSDASGLDSHLEEEGQGSEEPNHNVLERLVKAHAADLATDHANTTDPDNKQWTAERNRIHGEIVRDLYNRAKAVPCEHKAIIAGGLPGAGKTTVLAEHAGIDQSKYLTINPDEIKEVLASRNLIPDIEGLSPMEASDLAHEESSVIAKYLAHRAQAEGKNLIWDVTMSRLESTQERIDSLRESGYQQIDAIFVDIPIEVSIRRTQARHREGQESWQAGHGMGGRFVPPEIIRKQADPEWGSKNKKNFGDIKSCVNNWSVFDNGVDGRRAILVDSKDFHKTSQDL
jgi:predicted ABC-type ATPase